MKAKNLAVVSAVAVSAVAVLVLKTERRTPPAGSPAQVRAEAARPQALPRLVDLGAGKCIPCKAMKPILEDLKANYAEAFKTEFIDVWENRAAAEQHRINLIPTQIFFSADGRELFRHEGFFSKEDILAKWKELGVGLTEKSAQNPVPDAQR